MKNPTRSLVRTTTAEKGGYAYKVGTKEKQHVVAVEPNGKSTLISLMYVESPKETEKD